MDQLLESRASTTADVHIPEHDLVNLVKARMRFKGIAPKEGTADTWAGHLIQESGVSLVKHKDEGTHYYVIPKGYPGQDGH